MSLEGLTFAVVAAVKSSSGKILPAALVQGLLNAFADQPIGTRVEVQQPSNNAGDARQLAYDLRVALHEQHEVHLKTDTRPAALRDGTNVKMRDVIGADGQPVLLKGGTVKQEHDPEQPWLFAFTLIPAAKYVTRGTAATGATVAEAQADLDGEQDQGEQGEQDA